MNWLNRSDRKAFIWLFVIAFVLGIIAIFFYHWKIQLMYNSSSVSLYTPNMFNINSGYKREYYEYISKGTKEMKNSTIVISTLIRDVAENIQYIKKRTERLGEEFLDYRILIVENDSSDGTRVLLKEWVKENPKVILLGCGVNSLEDECHISQARSKTEGSSIIRGRIEKMVYLRNIYLNYIKRNLQYFDYCAIWDLDIIGSVYIDGVANTIGHFISPESQAYNADGICAYGIRRILHFNFYYDTYAHIDKGDSYHIDLHFIHHLKKTFSKQYNRGEPPILVESCFSGFTIYQISSLLKYDAKYDMSSDDNLECEHFRFNKKFKKIYLNPSMIHLVLHNK